MSIMPSSKIWRPVVATIVLVATVAAFVDYFVSHPGLRQQLRHTSPGVLLLLLFLYMAFVGSLALVNSAAMRLCQTSISANDSLLLTMYSSIINFFGPLQSGPAFRALYLKQRYNVKIRDYASASFLYYLFYGLASGLLLLSGLIGWWVLVLLMGCGVVFWGFRRSNSPRLGRIRKLNLAHWYYMAGATLLQVGLLVVIFAVELKAVTPAVQLSQILVYTGAANLALFVSLTPGAIGFRESFLLFSQRLHHIDNSTIVAANLIDRSVYISLLLLLAVAIFGTHANRRFRPHNAKAAADLTK